MPNLCSAAASREIEAALIGPSRRYEESGSGNRADDKEDATRLLAASAMHCFIVTLDVDADKAGVV